MFGLRVLFLTFITYSIPISAGALGQPFHSLQERVQHFEGRYNLDNPYDKKVSNKGEGFEDLYGTRNFRVVLNGVFYRGGANNYYHRDDKRDNRNPLPDDGLKNLCAEEFSASVYLYAANFKTAPNSVSCNSRRSDLANNLKYLQISPLLKDNAQEIIQKIFININSPKDGPIYAHCWNGWHASGYISAVSLMQFCNWSADEAVDYWDKNTDGVNKDPNYERIRNKIRSFSPDANFAITDAQRSLICPSF